MSVTLPPDLERRVEEEVAAGRANSADSFVAGILRAHFQALRALREELDEASAHYRTHGGTPVREVQERFAERYRADED